MLQAPNALVLQCFKLYYLGAGTGTSGPILPKHFMAFSHMLCYCHFWDLPSDLLWQVSLRQLQLPSQAHTLNTTDGGNRSSHS